MTRKIELIFAATQNYLPYYTVLARSVAANANGRAIKINFLYTTSFNKMPDFEWMKYIDCMHNSLADFKNLEINFCDITEYMPLLDGQNLGMWGNNTSLSHYIYLFATIVLPHVKRAIYMDCDMICNANLGDVFDTDMHNKLIALTRPSHGDELSDTELGPDASNTGFMILNLERWRKLNVLDDILQFGRTMPRTSFCDQALIYHYFNKNHPNEIKYLDASYNIFPGYHPDMPSNKIKVMHFTSYRDTKPWAHLNSNNYRGADVWWKYARQTSFYENFISGIVYETINDLINKHLCQESKLHRLFRQIKTFKC